MLVYSTLFNVSPDLQMESFIKMAIEWVSNKNSRYNFPEIQWNYDEELKIKTLDDKAEFRLYVLIEKSTVAVRLSSIDDDNILWVNYYALVGNELYVELQKYSKDDGKEIDSFFNLPYLLTSLFRNNLIIRDEKYCTQNNAYMSINTDNHTIVRDLILNGNDTDLPIVYISKYTKAKYDKDYAISKQNISKKLLGLSYVLVEQDTAVSRILKDETNYSNPYNGAVQIFFPNNTTKRFIPSTHIISDIFKTLLDAKAHLKIDDKFTYSHITNEIYKIKINQLKEVQESSERMSKELKCAENMLFELSEQNDSLRKDIYSYQIQIEALKKALNERIEKPLMNQADITEIYQNEQFECVYDALKEYYAKYAPNKSRLKDILKAILDNNKPQYKGTREELISRFEKIITESTIDLDELEKLGLKLTQDGKHYKAKFPNSAPFITISKTPSDSVHGPGNIISQFRRML